MFGLIVCLLIWISAQGPSWSFEKGHLHLDDYVAPQKVVNIMGEYAAMEETPFSTTPDHIFQGFLNKNLIATVYLYNWDNRIIEPTICVHHTVQGKRYATLIMKYLMSEIEKEEYKGYIIAAQREIQGGRTPFHSFLYRAGFKVLGRNTQEFWGYVYVRPAHSIFAAEQAEEESQEQAEEQSQEHWEVLKSLNLPVGNPFYHGHWTPLGELRAPRRCIPADVTP